MKVLVLGWMRMSGTGKDSNKPYDFARLLIASPIVTRRSERSVVEGDGFEAGQIDLRTGCEGEFQGIKFPQVLELKTDNKLGRSGRVEVEVVGVVRPAAVAKAG